MGRMGGGDFYVGGVSLKWKIDANEILHLMVHEVDKKSIRYEQEIYRVRTKA